AAAQRALLFSLGLYIIGHIVFVILSRTFADANIRLRDRHLAPVFPMFLAMMSAAVMVFLPRDRGAIAAAVGGLLLLVGFNAARTWVWVQRAGDMGQAYSTTKWHKSATMKIVNSAPPNLPIYTDGYDAVYLLTGRIVNQLPKAKFQSMETDNP